MARPKTVARYDDRRRRAGPPLGEAVMMRDAVIGVDIGTGSARAGVFALDGTMLAQASRPIRMWKPSADLAQPSTADIWSAVVQCVRMALEKARDVRVRGLLDMQDWLTEIE